MEAPTASPRPRRAPLRRWARLAWALALSGCASAPPATPADALAPAPADDPSTPSLPSAAAPATSPGGAAAGPRPLEESRSIARAELERFLNAGIPATLQQVPVQPVFSKGHLLGYQVISAFAGDPGFAARAGIQAGDVVCKLNGHAVARPEDLWTAWESLRGADHFAVEVLRDGETLQLRWKVEDARAAAP